MDKPILEHEWDLQSVDFPLTKDSTVFEIGGYTGRWASVISEMYHPNLYVFEPQPWAWAMCKNALQEYPKTQVFEIALGVTSGIFPMQNFGTDGCTFVRKYEGKPVREGHMFEIVSFLLSNGIQFIDLCLMNIEGYEFYLIPHMIRHRIFDHMKYFMCQFHPENEAEQLQYRRIRDWFGTHGFLTRFDFGTTLICWEKL